MSRSSPPEDIRKICKNTNYDPQGKEVGGGGTELVGEGRSWWGRGGGESDKI